ncbi:MAG TPA: GntR family transcriptional regulator [Symbiobacteriaceae bacterium]|nr:GntR family transcriptional regulator [Symbiobacteriaceae bacterium]
MPPRPGDTPLYTQIKQHLEEEIRSGRLRPGERIPSEAELAQQFKVSRITSKQALVLLAREGLVFRIPGKGSYVSEEVAEPRTGPRRTLGLVLPVLTSRYELELLRGAEAEARSHAYTLAIRQSDGLQGNEAQAATDLQAAGVDGLIIWPVDGEYYNPALIMLSMEKFPTVLVDRSLPGIPLPAVTSDNRDGGRQAAGCLTREGHRRIAVLSHPGRWAASIADRLMGFSIGLGEAGIPLREDLWLLNLNHDLEQNRMQIREFLGAHPEVTGVLTVNDGIGMAAYLAAGDLGRSVPEALSIVCFDQSNTAWPMPVTHVAQRAEEMGRQAVQMALELLSGRQVAPEQVQVPVSLVEGRTCTRST